jgi:hypothetical protein
MTWACASCRIAGRPIPRPGSREVRHICADLEGDGGAPRGDVTPAVAALRDTSGSKSSVDRLWVKASARGQSEPSLSDEVIRSISARSSAVGCH